jgi:hypothetical protein
MGNKRVIILGGGTVAHVRNHLAISAPAYGATAKRLSELCLTHSDKLDVELVLTKMAGGGSKAPETIEEVESVVQKIVSDLSVKIVFFNVAMVDFSGVVDGEEEVGKYATRLKSRETSPTLKLTKTKKIITQIRSKRKDIFLIGFKTTCGSSEQDQYLAGLNLLKEASCNLVLANDTKTRLNMVITPEEASYHVTTNRDECLKGLVEMAYLRSHLTFTRSTIVSGEPVSWSSELVPESLRTVVDHCISKGAYKPFRGSTVGHFAVKVNEKTFLTSQRKTNFNELSKIGLVKIETDGPDSVLAYGSRPSVGGQSQRIVFNEHQEYDCIVHFHCPLKAGNPDNVPVMSQREYECGSHECGKNTSNGLKKFGEFSVVMLDRHGPNIVFNKSTNPQKIIDFIERNFDLVDKTGGYNVLKPVTA